VTKSELLQIAFQNPVNLALHDRLRLLRIPGCYLTAGCLFQAVWNRTSGRLPDWGIKDYDVFYFDNSDLSWKAEDAMIRRVRDATDDLHVNIEVKNQARVHLWYPERFHESYPQLHSAREGIDRFLISCTCVGLEVDGGNVYAPNGLLDLASGTLRMNPLSPFPNLFREKAASYQARWPWLQVLT
jgi:hypothetical protein